MLTLLFNVVIALVFVFLSIMMKGNSSMLYLTELMVCEHDSKSLSISGWIRALLSIKVIDVYKIKFTSKRYDKENIPD